MGKFHAERLTVAQNPAAVKILFVIWAKWPGYTGEITELKAVFKKTKPNKNAYPQYEEKHS